MKKLVNNVLNYIDKHEKLFFYLMLLYFLIRGITYEETAFTLMPITTALVFIVEVLRVGYIKIDFREILIVVSLLLFYFIWGQYQLMGIGVASMSVGFYYMGKSISLAHFDDERKTIEFVATSFMLGIFILGVLSYIPFFVNSINHGEWIEIWKSFWRGNDVPRTDFDQYFAPFGGLLFYSGYKIYTKDDRIGLFYLIIALGAFVIPCLSEGRMVLCTSILTFGITIVLIGIRHIENKKIVKRVCTFVLACIGLFAIGEIAMYFDILGLGTLFKNSWLNGSMGLLHNIRFNMKADSLKLLIRYPWGRCDVPMLYPFYNNLPYDDPHDLWLLVARRSGIIPFLLFIGIAAVSTTDLIKLWIRKRVETSTAICLTGGFYSINFYCWCESVLFARPYMWVFNCFVWGMIRGLNLSYENEQKG